MKKLFALILALMMALTCVSAFADTVSTRVTVDRDVASTLLTGFGMTEDQMALIDPVLSLVNALGVKVITAEDGAQIDLNLNDKTALSLGFAMDEQGVTIASTMFPNYAITMSQETISQMMEQFMSNMPGSGSGEGGMDVTAMTEVFGKYFTSWFEACAAAGQPGEPVTGEYEFEGYTFDTMVPVTVDMAAITEATKTLMDDLLADPVAMGMIKSYAQSVAQSSGEAIDDASFDEAFKAGFEEWMAHFPETASAEYYTNSDSEGVPFYMTAEAMREGETEPFTCCMLMIDANKMSMSYQDGSSSSGSFVMDGSDMTIEFEMEGMYFGLAMSFAADQFKMDIFFMDDQKPLISVVVEMAQGGERTLSMDTSGKTVLAVEDLMNDQSGTASQGLLGDVMTNGLNALTGILSSEVPEFMGIVSALLTSGD